MARFFRVDERDGFRAGGTVRWTGRRGRGMEGVVLELRIYQEEGPVAWIEADERKYLVGIGKLTATGSGSP